MSAVSDGLDNHDPNVNSAGTGRLAELLNLRGGQAAAEAPFVIEHREALVYMLCQAAELEHGIMCQYMYAAYSLKQAAEEGLRPDAVEKVAHWRRTILHVATEEMLHLALVQNLLSAIGAAPHLSRPNLPAPPHHFPAGVNLLLEPFGEAALEHFIFLERPEGMPYAGADGIDGLPGDEPAPVIDADDIVPQAQDFATISHLYRSIEEGFSRLVDKYGEERLFVGPPRAQATAASFGLPELVAVTDLASAREAIDTILEQGEGARGAWETSHFGQFVAILAEYRAMRAENPDFDPARPVTFATVRRNEYDSSVPRITDPLTARCTDLFNVSYEVLVQVLERYFAHTDETDDELATLVRTTHQLMGGVLAPLGGLLTTLPVGEALPGRNAAPSFEVFYQDDDLLPHRRSAWILIEERLRDVAALIDHIDVGARAQVGEVLHAAQHRLTAIADGFAAHIAEQADAQPTELVDGPEVPDERSTPMVFDSTIKPLFRQKDREAMRFAFDLWSYDDVSTHADAILQRVEDGSMPCDGTWSDEQQQTFRTWIDEGMPA